MTLSCLCIGTAALVQQNWMGKLLTSQGIWQQTLERAEGSHLQGDNSRHLCRSNNASPSTPTDTGTQQMAHRSQISPCMPRRSNSAICHTCTQHTIPTNINTWNGRAQGDLGENDQSLSDWELPTLEVLPGHLSLLREHSLLPNKWPDTQEHLEAGLVFHNPTTLQGEAKH